MSGTAGKPIWFDSRPTALRLASGGLVQSLGIELTEAGDDWLAGRMPVDERTHQPVDRPPGETAQM